ncbi:patatin, partial [bacterium]|nr:patatin [bacterium]
CIPGVFIPVKMGDRLLLDGGILEPVPISPLMEMGAETTIGVNLFARRSYHKPSNVADLLINALDMMMVHIARLQLQAADLVVEPDLDKFNLVDTRQVPKLIEIGYAAAKEAFEGVV